MPRTPRCPHPRHRPHNAAIMMVRSRRPSFHAASPFRPPLGDEALSVSLRW